MKRPSFFAKTALAGVAGLAALLGVAVLVQSASAGNPIPGPQCGPTIFWVCSGGGDDSVFFAGTVCEKNAFEAETGLVCVPFPG